MQQCVARHITIEIALGHLLNNLDVVEMAVVELFDHVSTVGLENQYVRHSDTLPLYADGGGTLRSRSSSPVNRSTSRYSRPSSRRARRKRR